jgi:hypothetical protein
VARDALLCASPLHLGELCLFVIFSSPSSNLSSNLNNCTLCCAQLGEVEQLELGVECDLVGVVFSVRGNAPAVAASTTPTSDENRSRSTLLGDFVFGFRSRVVL